MLDQYILNSVICFSDKIVQSSVFISFKYLMFVDECLFIDFRLYFILNACIVFLFIL